MPRLYTKKEATPAPEVSAPTPKPRPKRAKKDPDAPKRELPAKLQERAKFFKEHYDDVRSLPNGERFKKLAEMYKASQE